MTDNEIIKALESCGNHLDCVDCECVDNCPQDINELNGLTFDLINRLQAELKVSNEALNNSIKLNNRIEAQNKDLAETTHNLILEKDALFDKAEELKAEVERLNALVKTKNKLIEGLDQSISYAYDRAIKDFAEKMKDEIINDIHFSQIEKDYLCVMLNNLVKEMVGENNA